MPEPGLRERKKHRTREMLIDAAQELFCANGFEATTVDEIAAAVDVSPRTFFRYFTSKEDVALAFADEQITAMLDRFAAQPAGTPVLTGLRQAAVELVRASEAAAGSARARHQRMRQLVSASPALAAARTERGVARLDEVARLVGARMGVDPAVDPRPHLVASVALCAVQTTITAWRAAGRDAPDSELIGQAFDLLSAGLDYPGA
ncbi:DNA-binding transcriptional regulator, AcrR family [Amycolatopsis sacchari]|uniref:DNA-binding transcriptional regulator, AcrR family n=1 Tax=Amycolatopsis sacchari TaxID=115433 RepID=A0A1I3TBG0_9PSEU|nr:TetR family transcriptional regulator [Amycolatopsis sacchari]SFJ67873.1 DNA-binding transcriptional regulator, AcrR family [Amycolatopsis sacchari]